MSQVFGKWPRRIKLGCLDPPQLTSHPKQFQPSPCVVRESMEIINGRPYLGLKLYGVQMSGLLDSGASVTIKCLCPLIQKRKVDIKPKIMTVTTANGGEVNILGALMIPYECHGKKFEHETLIVKDMKQDLILGFDFWKKVGLEIERKEVMHIVQEEKDFSCEIALESHHRTELVEIINSFLIATSEFLGRTHVLEHKIETKEGAKPFFSRCYNFSPEMEKMISKEVDKMLAEDIIAPSKSPVCSSIIPVKKPDGSIRLCLDSRKLNEITVKDKYPMPSIPHILSRIQNVKFMSTIDLSKAFWQTPLSAAPGKIATSQELTAFVVPGRGLYHFKVMPFGLTNSPATQSRLMNQVLGYDLEPHLFVYVDDILLVAESIPQMLNLLREVAKRLKAANLTINLQKSRFFTEEVKYVGYVLSRKGISADPEKIEVMSNYPKLKNVKEVRRFLGMASYYRRLIKNFSGLASPLTNMLKQNVGRFVWDAERDMAFRELKLAMTTSPVVATPNFEEDFVLQCDASDVAAGAALGQIQDGVEVVIAYYSHKWGKHEKHWGPTEKEAASVLFAIKHFRGYIWGRPFTVVTDAMALTHVRTIQMDGSSRLSRWAVELNNYQMTVKHRAGRLQVVPDALSRAVEVIEVEEGSDAFQTDLSRKITEKPDDYPNYRVNGTKLLRYEKIQNDLGWQEFRWKQYVPEQARESLIIRWHERLAHQKYKKCLEFLRRSYFWPMMKETVQQRVNGCEICKAAKSRPLLTHVPMGASRNANFPFQRIAIDHWGPVPRSRRGNVYLLVVVDIFSKFVLLNPTPNAKAAGVVKFLEEEVFLKMGTPQTVISDNHRPLVGNRMQELLLRYNVTHWTISFHHSQANPTERYVRTVSEAIRATVLERQGLQREWDTELAQIQWALNTTKSDTTNKSPFFVVFGRETLPSGEECDRVAGESTREEMTQTAIEQKFEQLRTTVKCHTAKAQEAFKRNYDKDKRPTQFQVGERVWRKNRELSRAADHVAAKLTPRFVPCTIVRRLGPETYEVRNEMGSSVAKVPADDLVKD